MSLACCGRSRRQLGFLGFLGDDRSEAYALVDRGVFANFRRPGMTQGFVSSAGTREYVDRAIASGLILGRDANGVPLDGMGRPYVANVAATAGASVPRETPGAVYTTRGSTGYEVAPGPGFSWGASGWQPAVAPSGAAITPTPTPAQAITPATQPAAQSGNLLTRWAAALTAAIAPSGQPVKAPPATQNTASAGPAVAPSAFSLPALPTWLPGSLQTPVHIPVAGNIPIGYLLGGGLLVALLLSGSRR